MHTTLTIHVHAPARQSRYKWLDTYTLKVDVCAPREKGKANKRLITDLASYLQLSKQDIRIISGHQSTHQTCHYSAPC
jgi:uncharacterized protein YggU (UPF0235/DUF167 family)